jgi:hypothetical protein
LAKSVSQFDSDMAIAADGLKKQFISSPDEGLKQIQAKRQDLFEQYKSQITDPDVKIQFDANGQHFLNQARVLDSVWAFNANNSRIQKTHFDRLTQDADFAGQTDNFDEVLQKAQLLDRDREGFYQAWGGVLEGGKVIDAGQESMIKSYFYGQLSKGNAFKVLKEIEDGRLGPLEGDNGIISPMKLKEMKGVALRMATAGKEDAAALALVQAVQTNFNIDEALAGPISATEEKINSLSFEIAKKKKLETEGQVSPDEIKTLESQQKLLENIRNAQISRSEMYVTPDPEVNADMTSRFSNLFQKKNVNKPFKGTLEEVFKFQQDLVENRDRIDPALFKKFSLLTEKAFQSEIQGFVKGSKLQTKASWFGLGPLEAVDKGRLSSSKKLQNVFSGIIAKHKPEEGNKDLFETMKIFFDDLDEAVDIKDAPSLEAMSQDQLNQLVEGAKRKMQLQKMGLPVHLGVKDVIYRGGSFYFIVGYAPDGMPLVAEKGE